MLIADENHVHVYNQKIDEQTGESYIYVLMDEIVVFPNGENHRYSRRGNPAVDLLNNVLAHKQSNYANSNTHQHYEKLTMSILPFDLDMNKTPLRRDLKFVENFVDTVLITNSNQPILPISIREQLSLQLSDQTKSKMQTIYGKTWSGMDKFFEQGTLDANINALFQPFDIRDNDIDIMLVKFVSPLSNTLANASYHYYILDTIFIDSVQCIDLAFVPVNERSLTFNGHLYIVNDSSYAVRRAVLSASPYINLNWINRLQITQDYAKLPDGKWDINSSVMETYFALSKYMRHVVYARHQHYVQPANYIPTKSVIDSASIHTKEWWIVHRPIPLTYSELVCDTVAYGLKHSKHFQNIVKTMNVLRERYIPTSSDFSFETSKWDFGPVMNTISYNGIEGWRLRIGGMTTPKAHPQIFFRTYAAYGFSDKRPKGLAELTYSFNKKEKYPNESPRHAISLLAQYDLEVPGKSGEWLVNDNILNAISPQYWAHPDLWNKKGRYIARTDISYEHEWNNIFDLKNSFGYELNQAAGEFTQPKSLFADTFQTVSWKLSFKYTPKKPNYAHRTAKKIYISELSHNALNLSIDNHFGYIIESNTLFDKIETSVFYRLWMSAFGYLDISAKAGLLTTFSSKGNSQRLPYAELFYPAGNQSIFLAPNSFALINDMEFAADKYAQLFLTYHLNGLILNRIPYVNMLRLREVVGINGYYGHLGKNNQMQGLKTMSNMPYLELNVGIENIFRFLRIDYVRRLTYTDGLGPWQRNGIRITYSFMM